MCLLWANQVQHTHGSLHFWQVCGKQSWLFSIASKLSQVVELQEHKAAKTKLTSNCLCHEVVHIMMTWPPKKQEHKDASNVMCPELHLLCCQCVMDYWYVWYISISDALSPHDNFFHGVCHGKGTLTLAPQCSCTRIIYFTAGLPLTSSLFKPALMHSIILIHSHHMSKPFIHSTIFYKHTKTHTDFHNFLHTILTQHIHILCSSFPPCLFVIAALHFIPMFLKHMRIGLFVSSFHPLHHKHLKHLLVI